MTLLMPVQTQWGTHTLTQATRLLLKAALANPLNQRFTLVCGSTLPVRPALFTYVQLMGESRSRFGVEQGWFRFHESDEVGSAPSPIGILKFSASYGGMCIELEADLGAPAVAVSCLTAPA